MADLLGDDLNSATSIHGSAKEHTRPTRPMRMTTVSKWLDIYETTFSETSTSSSSQLVPVSPEEIPVSSIKLKKLAKAKAAPEDKLDESDKQYRAIFILSERVVSIRGKEEIQYLVVWQGAYLNSWEVCKYMMCLDVILPRPARLIYIEYQLNHIFMYE